MLSRRAGLSAIAGLSCFIKKERWGLNIAGGNEGRGVSPPQRSENTQALVGAWIGRLLAWWSLRPWRRRRRCARLLWLTWSWINGTATCCGARTSKRRPSTRKWSRAHVDETWSRLQQQLARAWNHTLSGYIDLQQLTVAVVDYSAIRLTLTRLQCCTGLP